MYKYNEALIIIWLKDKENPTKSWSIYIKMVKTGLPFFKMQTILK